MNCRETQSLIIPFIEGQLEIDQLSAFLDHVMSCSDCYDELEVYYIALSGARQLDNDEDVISDFKSALAKFLTDNLKVVSQRKKKHLRKKLILFMCFLILLCIVLFILF